MDDPIRNDSLKSSDRLKQEANDLAYCRKLLVDIVLCVCKIFRKNTQIYVIFNFAIYLLVKYNLFKI